MKSFRPCLIALALLLAPGAAWAAPSAPTVSKPTVVVPSSGLPPEVHDNRSNNNLHLTRHGGRLFLVFRTAHWHLAADDATLYVVSTTDEQRWRFEGSFSYQRDLREARLMSWRGHLFLYFALLGGNAAAFEPGGFMATEYQRPGHWSQPKRLLQEDFIPWGVKVHDGIPYMAGYTGGGGTFSPNPPAKKEYWLTTSDGFDWHPVNPARPVVYTGQCGEVDFDFTRAGDLITACQTENKDALGWGAKVCRAPARDTSLWHCRGDTRRLDSPFVFRHGDQMYVVARRQPFFGGEYDLHHDSLPDDNARFADYDASYAQTPKRCSVWSIDANSLEFQPLVDVPGMGDTCYPDVKSRGRDRYELYNYTSPLDGPDLPWLDALTTGTTEIYRATLSFPASPRSCLAGSRVGRRGIGGVRLGYTRNQALRRTKADPIKRTARTLRWCVAGKRRQVTAAFSRRGRAVLVTVNAAANLRAYPRRRAVTRGVFRARSHGVRVLLVGVRHGRVRLIAVADARLLHHPRVLLRYLRIARRPRP